MREVATALAFRATHNFLFVISIIFIVCSEWTLNQVYGQIYSKIMLSWPEPVCTYEKGRQSCVSAVEHLALIFMSFFFFLLHFTVLCVHLLVNHLIITPLTKILYIIFQPVVSECELPSLSLSSFSALCFVLYYFARIKLPIIPY